MGKAGSKAMERDCQEQKCPQQFFPSHINIHTKFKHPGRPEETHSVISVTTATLSLYSPKVKSAPTGMAVPRVDRWESRQASRLQCPFA